MAITLTQSLRDVSTPLFALAQGKITYDQAVQKGEIWTKAALKLALTAAMFFSYRFALSMANPLLGLSLIAISICIHPVASMNAIFLISVFRFIPSARQVYLQHCISRSLFADLQSKNLFNHEVFQLTPEVFQPWRDSVQKGSVLLMTATVCLVNGLFATLLSPLVEQDLTRFSRVVRWLDQKIVTASKDAAPCIASFFGYHKPTH